MLSGQFISWDSYWCGYSSSILSMGEEMLGMGLLGSIFGPFGAFLADSSDISILDSNSSISYLFRAVFVLILCSNFSLNSFFTYRYSSLFWISTFNRSFSLLWSSSPDSRIFFILSSCSWASLSSLTPLKYFSKRLFSWIELTIWQLEQMARSHLCRCSAEQNLMKTLVRFFWFSSRNYSKRSTITVSPQYYASFRLLSQNYCREDRSFLMRISLSNRSSISYPEYYNLSNLSPGMSSLPINPSRDSDSLKQLVLLVCWVFSSLPFSSSSLPISSLKLDIFCSSCTFSSLNFTTSSSNSNWLFPFSFLSGKSGLKLESFPTNSSIGAPWSGTGGLCALDVWSCFVLTSNSLIWLRSKGAFLVRSLSYSVSNFKELSRFLVLQAEDIFIQQYFYNANLFTYK